MPRLLLIDADVRLSAMVADYLRNAGFGVDIAATLSEGRRRLLLDNFDALVLDFMMPDGDGLEFTRELRADSYTRQLPLLIITARGGPLDRIVSLDLGTSDYLAKPFEPRELLARLKALLLRARPVAPAVATLRFGQLEIDLGEHKARLVSREVELTAHQFDLLRVLAQHAGRVMTRDQITDMLKGHGQEAFGRSIDVHVSRIRALIEDEPRNPRRLITVRGMGYLFAPRPDDKSAAEGVEEGQDAGKLTT